MRRLFRYLCLALVVLPLIACGQPEPVEVPIEEDPALMEEGNPSAEGGGEEFDPAL